MQGGIFIPGISLEEFWQEHEARTRAVVEQVLNEHNAKADASRRLSANEVCQQLGITRPTLDAYSKDGKIRKMKIRGKVFYEQSDVDKALLRLNPSLKKTG